MSLYDSAIPPLPPNSGGNRGGGGKRVSLSQFIGGIIIYYSATATLYPGLVAEVAAETAAVVLGPLLQYQKRNKVKGII